MQDPWGEDAATHWSPSDFAYLKAVGGREILDFCNGTEAGGSPTWNHRSKSILVGMRGLGKSYLLAYRSYHHREAASSTTYFHPANALVESLSLITGGIAYGHWLRSRDAAESWSAVWQLS